MIDYEERTVNVLLMEACPNRSSRVRQALTEGGVIGRLHRVGNPVEALAYLRRDAPYFAAPRPDVLLLGQAAPESCGCDFGAELRQDPELAELRMFLIADDSSDTPPPKAASEYCDLPTVRLADLAKVISRLETRADDSWKLQGDIQEMTD